MSVKTIPRGTKKKGELLKVSRGHQKSKRKRAKNIPGGTKKKESSSKSLNDVKKSERKSASHRSFGHWSLVLNEYDKWLSQGLAGIID